MFSIIIFFPTENCTWQVAVETSQNVWGNWASHSDNDRPHFERSKNWDSDGKTWMYVNLQKSSIWQQHVCKFTEQLLSDLN